MGLRKGGGNMMKNNLYAHICFSVILAIIAIIFSTIALCNICPRLVSQDKPGFDYLGVIVGVLALLVTVLIGLNIVDSVRLRKEWDLLKSSSEKKQKNFKSLIEKRIDSVHEEIKEYAEESVKKSVIHSNMRLAALMVSIFYLDRKYELMLSFIEFGLNQSALINDEEFTNNFLKYIKKIKDIGVICTIDKSIKEELMRYVLTSSSKDELLDYVSNFEVKSISKSD